MDRPAAVPGRGEALKNRIFQGFLGFRNVAVHNYQALDVGILRDIVERHLEDFEAFRSAMLRLA